MREPKPPYVSHEALVAEVAELKASFSAMRLANLEDTIGLLHHQIKTLRERNEKDVETIDRFKWVRVGNDCIDDFPDDRVVVLTYGAYAEPITAHRFEDKWWSYGEEEWIVGIIGWMYTPPTGEQG